MKSINKIDNHKKEYGDRNLEDTTFYSNIGTVSFILSLYIFGSPFNPSNFWWKLSFYTFSLLCLFISLWIGEPDCYKIKKDEKQ